jgi:hypothetical protein
MAWIVHGSSVPGSVLRFPWQRALALVLPPTSVAPGLGTSSRSVEQPATGAWAYPTHGCRPVYHVQIPSHLSKFWQTEAAVRGSGSGGSDGRVGSPCPDV